MHEKILNFKQIKELMDITANCYRLGWDERNGGNISCLLDEEELKKYLDLDQVKRNVKLNFDARDLAGEYFLVTGSGKYFKNIECEPEENIGIIRISDTGDSYDILWGFGEEGVATSELATHLMNHRVRMDLDHSHRVIFHCHPPFLNALTFTQELDEKKITKLLWQMISECIIVFPEGIGLIPWRVPGTNEIGIETSEKMKDMKMVLWPHHGVFASGSTIDEAFGLIETAEKAAQIYTYACHQGEIKQAITDQQLIDLAKAFHVKPREGILKTNNH